MSDCYIFLLFLSGHVTPAYHTHNTHMGYFKQAVRSRWAVPMAAFLIQLSQYWATLVTIAWWSKRATASVAWFCVLWIATIVMLEIFLNRRISFLLRCLLGAAVIAGVAFTAMAIIYLRSGDAWLSLGYDEIGYLIITYTICLLIGSIVLMINKERQHEKEIEMLRLENLSSQYNAIANQISPHFFFNALSNLSSLIRSDKKQESLEYIGNLSGIFRYIIRFKESSLTTLGEELNFINSYKQLMDVRFARSYTCEIDVPQQALNMRMPSLSLLPLFENIVKHNIIDSEHHMRITIWFNERNELAIANPVFPKLTPPESNGIGLTNLRNRYRLLLGKEIRVEATEGENRMFRVFLPMVEMNLKQTK